jgi:glycyl-tRNA synthetase alpha subunit
MTSLQIINLSLSTLGQATISQAQLTADAHPSAVAANDWYEPCRDEVLGANNWSFATVTQALTALDVDDIKWEYCYSYPDVTLAVSTMWHVYNEATANTKDQQEFTVKYIPTLAVTAIYTDLEDAYAEYTYKVTDTTLWTTQFVMALVYRLASAMAVTLTGAKDKGIEAGQLYNVMISDAKRLSFSEKPKKEEMECKYIEAR